MQVERAKVANSFDEQLPFSWPSASTSCRATTNRKLYQPTFFASGDEGALHEQRKRGRQKVDVQIMLRTE